jgi:hypothetical protein
MEKIVTLCVMSCGETTLPKCLAALEPFRERCVIQEVRNVFPQIKALNQMIEQVQTPYLVPVDSDMILEPDAYERIQRAIDKYSHDPKWHSILFPLWDVLTQRKILALKVLRSEVMKSHPFVDSPTPDIEHFQRLTAAGYTCITNYLERACIGNHVVQGPYISYHKYRDVYLTLRSHDREWDQAVFMGGGDVREKSKKHFDFFFHRYVLTGNEDYIYCIAGMLDGLLSEVDHRSKSLEQRPMEVTKKHAVARYLDWYIKTTNALGGDAL